MSEKEKSAQKAQETNAASTTTGRGLSAAPAGGGAQEELEKKLEQLSAQETEQLVSSFKDHFDKCTKACKKPNILVAGITGAGKSTLVNAVFDLELAKAGVGMPVTQHFQKFEPADKPVVIYDSKGLEWDEHEAFIKETGKFFSDLRKKPDVADHIHIVWYVVNAARGRFESFEAEIVREVFSPTPVIFVLNKCDLADAKQLKAIKKVIEDEKLENNKGIHICVSDRTNWTQSWCPECLSDDVIYDEETKELECSDCGFTCILKNNYGMKKLINETVKLLPELAKDAFMYSQTASVSEKDKRAKNIVKELSKGISLDSQGAFIKKVAEMCAKLFVIWGWPLTANTFREGLAQMQNEYINQLKFKERLAAAAVDKLFGSRLSKAFSGLIGWTMNRGMKKLNTQLIEQASKGNLENVKVQDFMQEADINEDLIRMFFETALLQGINEALDKFWELSNEEVAMLAEQMNLNRAGAQQAGLFPELTEEDYNKILEEGETTVDLNDVDIAEVNADAEKKEESATTTTSEEKKPLLEEKKE